MLDLIVVGGGLLGTAVARDAALRGLSVTLFEKEDFAAGATSRMGRLAPGRLSALQTLDFTRVREDLREREVLLQIAPHLTRPQPCLVPFYQHGLLAQARLRASLALADALGFDGSLPLHQILSPSETLAREPSLRPEGLVGAALVWETLIPDVERFALEMALDARDRGASLHTHVRVERLVTEHLPHGRSRAVGVAWTDLLTGEEGHTGASLVVVAAGAWLSGLVGPPAGAALAPLVKSVSLLGPPLRGGQAALAFPQEEEGRLLFVLPQAGGSWVGSVETTYGGDLDTAHATGAEVSALTDAARQYLPDAAWEDVARAEAAVMTPLPPAEFPLTPPPSQIVDYGTGGGLRDGLLSVEGGSLTSCRSLAEEVVDLACRKLGRALSTPPCRTATTPLPGANGRYRPPASLGDEAALRAEVARVVSEEECRTLRDFLERRSGIVNREESRAAAPSVLEMMAGLLGWDRGRQGRELKAYEADIALTQAFRVL